MAVTSNSSANTSVKPGELITFTPLSAQGSPQAGKAIKAQYNPSSISYSESANYSENSIPHGSRQSKGNTLWNNSAAPMWSFKIFVDSHSVEGVVSQTLAITSPSTAATPTVTNKVKELRKLLLDINSETHEPNDLEVSFGSIIFRGNCVSFITEYKDFDVEGNPTSAEISMKFIQLVPAALLNASADLRSPDVTHSVAVEDGDHLTNISIKMYGTPDFFTEIARANNLDSIRGIRPGTVLFLPPLEK